MKHEARTTSTMTTTSCLPRTLKSIQNVVLHTMNAYLSKIDSSYKGEQTHGNFSKGKTGGRLSVFFTESGIMGMLRGKDYYAIDRVYPFSGAILYLCCGLTDSAPVMNTFTNM